MNSISEIVTVCVAVVVSAEWLESQQDHGRTIVSFPDLDFAADVALLAELLELLVPSLEVMASEAASLGLELNWQKTKVQDALVLHG